jgi:hypothetical protein
MGSSIVAWPVLPRRKYGRYVASSLYDSHYKDLSHTMFSALISELAYTAEEKLALPSNPLHVKDAHVG